MSEEETQVKFDATQWLKDRKLTKFFKGEFCGVTIEQMSLTPELKTNLLKLVDNSLFDKDLLSEEAATLGLACNRLRVIESRELNEDLGAFWEEVTAQSGNPEFQRAFGEAILELSDFAADVNEAFAAKELAEKEHQAVKELEDIEANINNDDGSVSVDGDEITVESLNSDADDYNPGT